MSNYIYPNIPVSLQPLKNLTRCKCQGAKYFSSHHYSLRKWLKKLLLCSSCSNVGRVCVWFENFSCTLCLQCTWYLSFNTDDNIAWLYMARGLNKHCVDQCPHILFHNKTRNNKQAQGDLMGCKKGQLKNNAGFSQQSECLGRYKYFTVFLDDALL